MKRKPLPDRLARAADLAVRARVHLDLFVFTQLADSASKHEEVLDKYADYFRFSRIANEWAFYVRINNLLTRNANTNNFPLLLEELEQVSLIDPAIAQEVRAHLERLNPIRKSVRLIRNKAVAHQDDSLAQREIYQEAQVSLNLLTQLSDDSLEIANTLAASHGQSPRVFFDAPKQTLERLLVDIAANGSSALSPLSFLK